MSNPPIVEEDDDDDEEEEEEEEVVSSDEDDKLNLEGAYNPGEFADLEVDPEVKGLFHYITLYAPQTIELDMKLKPFIPDYIPAVGDIDPFLKIPRPDRKEDGLGLTVVDEPSSTNQSDPTLLELRLKAVGKKVIQSKDNLSNIGIARTDKEINGWIENIDNLHQITASSSLDINLLASKRLPDVEKLMEEWDNDFEQCLTNNMIPKADLDVSLDQYISIVCAILDIPIYQSKLRSVHLLFNLFHEFQTSQHFRRI